MAVPPAPTAPEQPGADPSMEDILASIRRILNEDEASAADGVVAAPHPGDEGVAEDEVLVLDTSMIVAPVVAPVAAPVVPPIPAAVAAEVVIALPPPEPAAALPPTSDLLAPESEAAAVSSVGSLLQMLTKERSSQVHRGGPTIEDLVREEIRPLLKGWLDLHLPPLVERLVRVEIERVTGRAAP